MGTDDDWDIKDISNFISHFVNIHGAVSVFVSHLDTGTKMNRVYSYVNILHNPQDHGALGYSKPGQSTVCQGNNFYIIIMLRKLTVLFACTFETLCACDTSVIVDLLQ